MNYPPYNPYMYGQQAQQGPFMPQQVNQPMQMQAGQQPTQQAQAMPQGLSQVSRPVTSREEAMGVAADFSGALMVFPDIAHNRVYIKRWNYNTGAADFIDFAPEQPVAPQEPQGAFASIQELQDLQDIVDSLRQEVERLKRPQTQPKSTVRKEKADE